MPVFSEIEEEIASMLSIPDEELTDEQRAAMDAYLNDLASQEAAKVDGFAQFVKLQSNLAEACKAEAQRLAQKAKTAQSRIDWLKGRYLETMLEHGVKKIQGNAYTLSVRKTEAVTAPVSADFLEKVRAIRPDCVETVVTVKPVKAAIKEALKSGVELPGCSIVENMSLQVR